MVQDERSGGVPAGIGPERIRTGSAQPSRAGSDAVVLREEPEERR